MVSVRQYRLRSAAQALIVALALSMAGFCASATAEADQIGCGGFEDLVTVPGGGYVAAGKLSCPAPVKRPDLRPITLHKINPDGSLDTGFGVDGRATVPTAGPTRDAGELFVSGNQIISLIGHVATKFNGDGTIDETFGTGGQLELPFSESTFYTVGIGVQPDGKIIAAGDPAGADASPKLIRYDADGTVDPTFAGGYAEPPLPPGIERFEALGPVAITDEGKVLVAGVIGYSNYEIVLMRLESDGDLDTSFGEGGTGFAVTGAKMPGLHGGILARSMAIGQQVDDRIDFYWSISELVMKDVEFRTFAVSVDGTGQPIGDTREMMKPRTTEDLLPLPGGDLATSGFLDSSRPYDSGLSAPNEMGIGRFTPQGVGGFTDGQGFRTISATPGGGELSAMVLDEAGSSLVAAGVTRWVDCPAGNDCVTRAAATLVKAGVTTGKLDPGFGIGGIAMIPRNSCEGAILPAGTGHPPVWNRCVLTKPKVRSGAKFFGKAAKAPGIDLTARLLDPPRVPKLLERRVTIRLPKRLMVRKGGLKVGVKAITGGVPRTRPKGEVEVTAKGRLVTLRYKPTDLYALAGYSYRPANTALTFKVRVKRGSLMPIPKRLRGKKVNFRTTGTNLGGRWYGNSSNDVVTKARTGRR